MRILYINNDGGGFADFIEIADGTTVECLFEDRIPRGCPQDYLIRVNRQPVAAGHFLQEGDRVSFTPTKIEGAELTGVLIRHRLSSLPRGRRCHFSNN